MSKCSSITQYIIRREVETMLRILTCNREYIESIDIESYESKAIGVVASMGILNAIQRNVLAELYSDATVIRIMTFIIMSILVGAVVGSISAYLSSAIIRFTSSKLGGSSSYAETIVAYAVGAIPALLASIISIATLLFFSLVFDMNNYNSVIELTSSPFVKIAGWINMIGGAVCIVITPIIIAKVNGFSIIKGIISYLSMFVIPGVIIGLIVLLNVL